MTEAMPQPRTFSSSASAQPGGNAAPASLPPSSRATPRWLAPVLAALGGATAGAAFVALAVVSLGGSSPTDAPLAYGEPLDAGFARAVGAATPTVEATEIVVDVAGAVAQPGLHRLHAGDRVGDAIEAAGGFAPRVDLAATSQSLNLAQPLEDGTKVLVPELGIDRVETTTAGDGRIDLNRADQAELESLPGVGPVTAGKIIDARADRRFTTARDLRARGLVGESVFKDIKNLVRAG